MKLKLNLQPAKTLNLSRDQSRMLITVLAATAVAVFCLLSTKALLDQAIYNHRVLSAKRQAVKQLQANSGSLDTLKTQYEAFNSTNPNVLGGRNTADPNAVPPDGDNTRIVLDGLPTKYDFPALISSVSRILSINGLINPGISGSDQSATMDSSPATNPQPVEIPLTVTGLGSYSGAQNLVRDFERSIRPFDMRGLQLNGSSSSMSISLDLTTYFQPAKSMSSDAKEVR